MAQKNHFKKIAFGTIILVVIVGVIFSRKSTYTYTSAAQEENIQTKQIVSTTSIQSLPKSFTINHNGYYDHQTFNNCGPDALAMDLSFYNIRVDQQTLADILRPSNNLTGKGDDKSTPPDQIKGGGELYGLTGYFRPGGNIEKLKKFVAAGFPVMVRTLLKTSEHYAHYRVVKGYDDTKGVLIQEDGMQGENVPFLYADFMTLWKPFNNEYIVFATPMRKAELESLLGNEVDALVSWKEAAKTATDPFNLSVALYYTGDYQGSVEAFEKAKPYMNKYSLWYQIEPIKSLYETGQYDKVFAQANIIFAGGYTAHPEMYFIEGKSYLKLGNIAAAKASFQISLKYNKNYKPAQDALKATE